MLLHTEKEGSVLRIVLAVFPKSRWSTGRFPSPAHRERNFSIEDIF
jgi:hypothetical protein